MGHSQSYIVLLYNIWKRKTFVHFNTHCINAFVPNYHRHSQGGTGEVTVRNKTDAFTTTSWVIISSISLNMSCLIFLPLIKESKNTEEIQIFFHYFFMLFTFLTTIVHILLKYL